VTCRYTKLLIFILHGHFFNSFFGICFIQSCAPLNVRWNVDESGYLQDGVFEPNPSSCCVLTLPLLCIAKWMFLWPVRYSCSNVRHSSLCSQASDSINPFSFLLPCTEMSNRALDCRDLFPSVPQNLKLTLFLKFFFFFVRHILNPKLIFGFGGRSKGSRPLNPNPLQRPESTK